MATALDVIKRAMRLAGVYTLGEEPTADESANGLVALNGMLGEWSTNGTLIYATTTDTISLVASTQTYTIGATGTVVTTRPAQVVDECYVTYQGEDDRVRSVTEAEWNAIAFKTETANYPEVLFYNPTFPNGTLKVWPVPNASSSLKFVSLKPLTEFSALTTDVSLPPGYFEALCFNLAIVFGPEFDAASIGALVVKRAQDTKRAIRSVPMPTRWPADYGTRERSNIFNGP